MLLKKCTKCQIEKPYSDYYKNKTGKDGFMCRCKKCCNIYNKKRRKTVLGLISEIYKGQLYSSRIKGYNKPDYTNNDLIEWMGSQDNFSQLYSNWVDSGYDKKLIPSCDRLDDYKPYSFDNLRLITWQENLEKSHSVKYT